MSIPPLGKGGILTAANQCFGSIFIESRSGSGSSQKSQSGSRKALNPDPDLKINLNYFIIISFNHQKKSIKRKNVVKVTEK